MGVFLSSSSETSSVPQALPLQGTTITPSPAVAKGCLPSRTTSLLLGTAQTLRPAPLPCITLRSDGTRMPCRALQANSGYVNKMLSDTQRKYYNWPQQQRQHGVVFLSTILSSVVGLDTQDTCTRSQIETQTQGQIRSSVLYLPLFLCTSLWNKHTHADKHTHVGMWLSSSKCLSLSRKAHQAEGRRWTGETPSLLPGE